MICKTRGIVFKTIRYTDHSRITKIFTEEFGLRSYIIRGFSSKKNTSLKSALQPFSILHLVVYEKEKEGLQNIREIEHIHPYQSLLFDMKKSSIALFMNDIMYRSIHSEEPDKALFHFLLNALTTLDLAENFFENHHLYFLTELSRLLGFGPMNNFSPFNQFFDLQEGLFISQQPLHNNFLNPSLSQKLSLMISDPLHNKLLFPNADSRNEMLVKLIDYYRLHIPGFGEVKSHLVLKEILS